MATKDLNLYRLGVVLDVKGAQGLSTLKSADRELKAVDQDSRRAERSIGLVGGALNRLKSGFKGMFGGGGSGGFLPGLSHISNVIQGLPQIGQLAGALVSPLTEASEAGVKFNAFLETTQIGLKKTLFGGDREKARAYLKELRDFAGATPFRTEPLIKTAQYASVVTFQAQEIKGLLTDVGDTVAATGEVSEESVQSIVRAFGKIRGEGRVTAESMEMLTDAGVNGWEMLAHAIGKSVAETRKLSETGKLNGPAAVAAMRAEMRARYGGMMKELEATLTGRLSAGEDALQAASAKATEGLAQGISDSLGEGLKRADLVDTLAGHINTAITPVAGMVSASARGLLGGGITSGLAEGIDATKGVVMDAVKEMGFGSLRTLMEVLGINSPSRAFMTLGEFAGQGFALGLREALKKLAEENGGDLRAYLGKLAQDPRFKAWFETIRQVEGGAPRRVVGGATAPNSPRHPGSFGMGMKGPKGWSTAAGNWQITQSNWKALAPLLGLTDFRDVDQQMLAALALFAAEGGDKALLEGNFRGALKASSPWAATPLSHLPGRKPLSPDQFLSRYRDVLGGGKAKAVPVMVVGVEGGAGPEGEEFEKREQYSAEFGGMVNVARSREEWDAIDGERARILKSVKAATAMAEQANQGVPMKELFFKDLPLLQGQTSLAALAMTALERGQRDLERGTKELDLAFGHAAKSVIGSAKKMDSVMGAFGQVAGMMPGGQQVGKKRGFFSKMLGFAAPFLSFIPGVGPILSTLAGMGSSALAGDWGGVVAGAAQGFSTGGVFRRSGGLPTGSGASGSLSSAAMNNLGAGSTAADPLMSMFPRRALGGPVKGGRAYIVGEHRAEVFEPEEDGYVHPSMGAYNRSRGGGTSLGNVRAGSIGAMIQRLIDRIESVPPEHVLSVGAKRNPGAVTEAFMSHGSRDPRVVEWMNRRVAA